MTRWKLLVSVTPVFLAVPVIGAAFTTCFLLLGDIPLLIRHQEHWRFTRMPDDNDDGLIAWSLGQPQIEEFRISRSGDELRVRFVRRESLASSFNLLNPDWQKLGYEGGHLVSSSSMVSLQEFTFGRFVFVLCLQPAFLLFPLLAAIRKRSKDAVFDPLFAGSSYKALGYGALAALVILGSVLLHEYVFWYLGRPAYVYTIWRSVVYATPALRILLVGLCSIIVPICEEIFFRGYIFGRFAKSGFPYLGAVISASAFACLHFDPFNAVAYFFMGLLLALVYHRARWILAPITAHAINNSLDLARLLLTAA